MKNNNLYFDKITPDGKGLEPEIDKMTPYGKGLEPEISSKLDQISFKTCDGKDLPSMEDVMLYNQIYYDKMKKQLEEKNEMHR